MGMGTRSPGAPLGPRCPGASHAAFEPRAERAAGDSSAALGTGKATFVLWGSRSCQERPSPTFQRKYCNGISLPSSPQTLPAASPAAGSSVSPRPSVTRALGRAARTSVWNPRIPPASRAPNESSLSAAGGDRGPGFPASRPPRPHFSGIPGTSSKAPLGHPGPPPLPPPACKLVSGSSASGSYTARPGGLARPQDHPGVTAPRPAARLPATRFPQRSGSTPGPGPGAARTGPELGSRHLPGPFKFSHGGGRKCSGITGPPARTSCAREGATMEEHR